MELAVVSCLFHLVARGLLPGRPVGGLVPHGGVVTIWSEMLRPKTSGPFLLQRMRLLASARGELHVIDGLANGWRAVGGRMVPKTGSVLRGSKMLNQC